jgi:hypothetical protein
MRIRAVSIQVLPFEVHARWHFFEKNATWHPRFCKEQNRNRCSGPAHWMVRLRVVVCDKPPEAAVTVREYA